MVDMTSISIKSGVRRSNGHYQGVRGATKGIHDYIFDPNERKAKQPVARRRGRPRTTYNYSIKIVHDPLDCGGFASGTEFSILEKDFMLLCGTFTPGTSLIVDGVLHFVHSSSDNGQQCVRTFKPDKEMI